MKTIITNALFIVLGFLSGCGFDDRPETNHPVKTVESRNWNPDRINLHMFDGKLDNFETLGIPEGWGDNE